MLCALKRHSNFDLKLRHNTVSSSLRVINSHAEESDARTDSENAKGKISTARLHSFLRFKECL